MFFYCIEFLELSKMSEPELVVSIGEQDTLAGFSPWHIRLSEIMYDFEFVSNFGAISNKI